MGKLDAAIRSQRAFVEHLPNNATGWFNLGYSLRKQENDEEAIACYRKAIELRRSYWGAHNNLGAILKKQEKLNEAIAAFRNAVKYGRTNEKGWQNLRGLLVRQGKYDEAITIYKDAPDSPTGDLSTIDDVSFEFACLLLLNGDRDGYQQFCESLRQRAGRPRKPFLHFILTRTYGVDVNHKMEPSLVVGWGHKSIAQKPNAWFLHALSLAHYRAGEFEEAIQRAEESNKMSWEGERKSLNGLVVAMAQYRLGRRMEARETFLKAEKTLTEGIDTLATPDILEFEVLRREARKLLEINDPEGPKL